MDGRIAFLEKMTVDLARVVQQRKLNYVEVCGIFFTREQALGH